MALEKLSKKRLLQILCVLCVLISAFTYRTCQYDKVNTFSSDSAK